MFGAFFIMALAKYFFLMSWRAY